MAGLTSNYKRLEARSPVIEQIAAYKKRRGQKLSKHEQTLLAERKAKRIQQRTEAKTQGKMVAGSIAHPEREPGPITRIKPGAK